MDLFEAIRTTRAMRRLDPTRPVSDADIHTVLEAATKAPSGSNSQPVRWIVVTDPKLKRQVGEVYRRCASKVLKGSEDSPLNRSSWHLVEHMGDSPVLFVACTEGSNRRPASVFPAIQNLMLAARGLGRGTTLTTIHLEDEDAVKEILSIPERVVTYCIIPMGYPLGRWGEAIRKPVEEITYRDRWGAPLNDSRGFADAHIVAFNEAVLRKDFSGFVERFAGDATMRFENVPGAGTLEFKGRPAIAAAYLQQPPDDEIVVTGPVRDDNGGIVVPFAWRRDGAKGVLRLAVRRGVIEEMTVTFESET